MANKFHKLRSHSVVYKYEVEGNPLKKKPNQLISRLAKHQSIRALEGLEARLPHLLRGRHRRELLVIIDIKIFINKRSKSL